MLPFRLIYSDDYYLPIGAHVFPAEKYRLVHRRLLETKVAEPADFLTPQPALDQDILLVHKPEYVNKLKNGTLSPLEEMQMEIPYSPELVRAFWLSAVLALSATAASRSLIRLAAAAGIALVVAVAASRVYLGVHYPADVVAGIVLGAAWAAWAQHSLP